MSRCLPRSTAPQCPGAPLPDREPECVLLRWAIRSTWRLRKSLPVPAAPPYRASTSTPTSLLPHGTAWAWLCRYAGRPPVAIERLSLLPDGRLLYRLKRRWRNGTTHVIFEPLELIEKLAALVPAPRFNLVRYHGVFAPAAKWRADVVPSDPPSDSLSHRGCRRKAGMGDILTEAGCLVRQHARSRPRNYSWAELLHRVFSIDVLECASCGGRLRIVAAIHPPEAIQRILDCLGIPSRAPPIVAASRDAADWKFSE